MGREGRGRGDELREVKRRDSRDTKGRAGGG